MTELVNGPLLIDRLRKAFRKPRKARLAVAFWGKGAAKRLGIREGDDVKIVCNLAHGGTNPDEIARLQKLGLKVRQHSRLHAKIGVVGDLSFVGSSNMSTNGLGQEGNETIGWEEANIVCSGDPLDVETRFDTLWDASRRISKNDLKLAQDVWQQNQRNQGRRIIKQRKGSLLDAMYEEPKTLDAANVYIAIAMAANAEENEIIEAAQKAVERDLGEGFDVYLGWPTLPRDAYLIAFRKPPKGQYGFDGLYRRLPEIEDRGKGDESIQIVQEIPDILGLDLNDDARAAIRQGLHRCWLEHKSDNEACYVGVQDFLKHLTAPMT